MLANNKNLLILIFAFISLNVYLFASAPVPLPEEGTSAGSRQIPVEKAFELLAGENDAVRSLYTRKLVGEGEKVKLHFTEDWQLKSEDAGPLPSLFLRATAAYLEEQPLALSLFLGSDFPISTANKFSGIQEKYFAEMKQDKQPKYFFDESSRRYTAMFPDVAGELACVSCHNEHPDSPKKDWQLGDMMGATTWTFPQDSVSLEQLTDMLATYRQGARHTYTRYLDKLNDFSQKPEVGNRWPAEGYYVPSAEVFMDSLNARSAPATLQYLLSLTN